MRFYICDSSNRSRVGYFVILGVKNYTKWPSVSVSVYKTGSNRAHWVSINNFKLTKCYNSRVFGIRLLTVGYFLQSTLLLYLHLNVSSDAALKSQDFFCLEWAMSNERTFIAIKPDGVQRGLVGKIIKRFEQRGFKLVAMKLCKPGKEHLENHYADLKSKVNLQLQSELKKKNWNAKWSEIFNI